MKITVDLVGLKKDHARLLIRLAESMYSFDGACAGGEKEDLQTLLDLLEDYRQAIINGLEFYQVEDERRKAMAKELLVNTLVRPISFTDTDFHSPTKNVVD